MLTCPSESQWEASTRGLLLVLVGSHMCFACWYCVVQRKYYVHCCTFERFSAYVSKTPEGRNTTPYIFLKDFCRTKWCSENMDYFSAMMGLYFLPFFPNRFPSVGKGILFQNGIYLIHTVHNYVRYCFFITHSLYFHVGASIFFSKTILFLPLVPIFPALPFLILWRLKHAFLVSTC